MLESLLSQKLSDTFSSYQLWKPQNRAAGWPDVAIQLPNSQLIWCELKVTVIRTDKRILLSNLEKEQAAFLYKWQRYGGHCFVLAAVMDRPGETNIGYVVLRQTSFDAWLNANKTIYALTDLLLFDTMDQVLQWFRSTFTNYDIYASRRKK